MLYSCTPKPRVLIARIPLPFQTVDSVGVWCSPHYCSLISYTECTGRLLGAGKVSVCRSLCRAPLRTRVVAISTEIVEYILSELCHHLTRAARMISCPLSAIPTDLPDRQLLFYYQGVFLRRRRIYRQHLLPLDPREGKMTVDRVTSSGSAEVSH